LRILPEQWQVPVRHVARSGGQHVLELGMESYAVCGCPCFSQYQLRCVSRLHELHGCPQLWLVPCHGHMRRRHLGWS